MYWRIARLRLPPRPGFLALFALTSALAAQSPADPVYQPWRNARDRQDLAFLQATAKKAESAAAGNATSNLLYSAALARSFEAEIALELGKKAEAASAAEAGIAVARRLVGASPQVAEHHRILGTLCGQIIPANLLSAFTYGRCAREEIDTALRLDSRSAWAYLGRGVGNYSAGNLRGGVDKAIEDFRQASRLQPKLPMPGSGSGLRCERRAMWSQRNVPLRLRRTSLRNGSGSEDSLTRPFRQYCALTLLPYAASEKAQRKRNHIP